jgi:hypothetical protein
MLQLLPLVACILLHTCHSSKVTSLTLPR